MGLLDKLKTKISGTTPEPSETLLKSLEHWRKVGIINDAYIDALVGSRITKEHADKIKKQ